MTRWIIKPVDIDDVPIVTLALSSSTGATDAMELRRVADELLARLQHLDHVAKSWIVGGARRQMMIHPDPTQMASYDITLLEVIEALNGANVRLQAGLVVNGNREAILETGSHFESKIDVSRTVSKSKEGRPVYLHNVANIVDGEEELTHYSRIGFGQASAGMRTIGHATSPEARSGDEREMVTIALAKRKGSNAVRVANDILAEIEALRGQLIPADVEITISRDYGASADHKVDELVKHLGLAIAMILVLLALSLGPKESLIVCIVVRRLNGAAGICP